MNLKEAFLVVDYQNDFIDGGTMAVEGSEYFKHKMIEIAKQKFTIASQDSHPINHRSFASVHNKNPGDIIKLSGVDQILWPDHCIMGTMGWMIQPELEPHIDVTFFKGCNINVDSYSAFYDNAQLNGSGYTRNTTGLHEYLQAEKIKRLYIAGLATDYCVEYTAIDALSLGYTVYVIEDLCGGVNLNPNDSQDALDRMEKNGANIVNASEILETF